MFNNPVLAFLYAIALFGSLVVVLGVIVPLIRERRRKAAEAKRLADMPVIYIADNNMLVAVATEKKFLQAFEKAQAAPERNGLYLVPVVSEIMLFSSNPHISDWTRAQLTGTLKQLQELKKGCQVKRADFFVPFSSTGLGSLEWQMRTFRHVSLYEAYRLVHGSLEAARRRGCNNLPSGSVQTGVIDVL